MPADLISDHRALIARVATLELLVSDLVDLLWGLDPAGMERLGQEAAHDLDIQHARNMPAGAENQRERLFAVLRQRRAKLERRRGRPGAPA